MLSSILRTLFTLCIVWPVIWLWLGLRIKHRERLPACGPAIIVANHNSHMDVFALLSLFPLRRQSSVHPVAAADYSPGEPFWFSRCSSPASLVSPSVLVLVLARLARTHHRECW